MRRLSSRVEWRTVAARARAVVGRPGRVRLYGTGLVKTGTHSLARIFSRVLTAGHEIDGEVSVDLACRLAAGSANGDDVHDWLRRRERYRLEIDVSHLHGYVIGSLTTSHPEALFIHTVRDCFTWIESWINHQLTRPLRWQRWRDLAFGGEPSNAPEERALRARGLYSLDGYFGYWARHNAAVLEAVPDHRLLIVPTDELENRLNGLARFAGLEGVRDLRLRPGDTRRYVAPRRVSGLDQVPRLYLQDVARRHCAPLMARWFPSVSMGPGA